MEETNKFESWANVEVIGHRRFAGRVSEQVIAGTGFVRIDVPRVEDRMPFTKLIGTSSIYCITPCSEEVARELARQYCERPVNVYSPSVKNRLEYDDDDEDEPHDADDYDDEKY